MDLDRERGILTKPDVVCNVFSTLPLRQPLVHAAAGATFLVVVCYALIRHRRRTSHAADNHINFNIIRGR
jgi:hypothetical protein